MEEWISHDCKVTNSEEKGQVSLIILKKKLIFFCLNHEVLSNHGSCEEWLEVGVGVQAEPAVQTAEIQAWKTAWMAILSPAQSLCDSIKCT